MNNKYIHKLLSIVLTVLFVVSDVSFVLAYQGETHKKITEEAITDLTVEPDNAYFFNLMLANLLNDGTFAPNLKNKQLTKGATTQSAMSWISGAAALFDDKDADHFLNHYYNPDEAKGLHGTGGALSEAKRLYDEMLTSYYNTFSLPAATDREMAFVDTLEYSGKIVHLLQDMSVPSYVQDLRAEKKNYTEFEKQVLSSSVVLKNYNFVDIATFNSLDMFFGNGKKHVDSSLGLASYTKNSFLAENMNNNSSDYKHLENKYNIEGSPTIEQIPVQGGTASLTYGGWRRQDAYRPDPANDYSSYMGLRTFLKSYYSDREYFIPDSKVITNQAEPLLQRAYGYSGGLLNFMFRGIVAGYNITPVMDKKGTDTPVDDEVVGCRFSIKNLSSGKLKRGRIVVFADKADGSRRVLYKTPSTLSADNLKPLGAGAGPIVIEIKYDKSNNRPASSILAKKGVLYKDEKISGTIVFKGKIDGVDGIGYGTVDMYNPMYDYYAIKQRDDRAPIEGEAGLPMFKYYKNKPQEDMRSSMTGEDKEVYYYEGGTVNANLLIHLRSCVETLAHRYYDTTAKKLWYDFDTHSYSRLYTAAFGAANYSRNNVFLESDGILLNDIVELEKCIDIMTDAVAALAQLNFPEGVTPYDLNREKEIPFETGSWATTSLRAYNGCMAITPAPRYHVLNSENFQRGQHVYNTDLQAMMYQAAYGESHICYRIYTKGLYDEHGEMYPVYDDKATLYMQTRGEGAASVWSHDIKIGVSVIDVSGGAQMPWEYIDGTLVGSITTEQTPIDTNLVKTLEITNFPQVNYLSKTGWSYGSIESQDGQGTFVVSDQNQQMISSVGIDRSFLVYAPVFNYYTLPEYKENNIIISGVVVDASQPAATVLKDALVTIDGMQINSVTDKEGRFVYPTSKRGYVTVKASKQGYTEQYKTVKLKEGDTDINLGEFRLVSLNADYGIGTAGGTVSSDDATMQVVFPAGVLTENKQIAVTPIISVSQMPMRLPSGIAALYGVKITPADLIFSGGNKITLKANDANLNDGMTPDIMHYDYTAGKWNVVGSGTKLASGVISADLNQTGVFVVGFPNKTAAGDCSLLTPLSESIAKEEERYKRACNSVKAGGSLIDVARGALYMPHAVTGVSNMYGDRSLNFWYSSSTASPSAVIGMDALFDATAANAEITFSVAGGSATKYFTSAAETASIKYIFPAVAEDGEFLPSGIYPYTIESTNSYYLNYYTKDAQGDLVDTGITSTQPNNFTTVTDGHFSIVNQKSSAFGAGWSLDELYRLQPENTNGQVFLETEKGGYLVFDKAKGAVAISKNTLGGETNGNSTFARSSADALYTVFASDATDIVAGDTNGKRDIFLYNSYDKTTTRINLNVDGTEANDTSDKPHISADGRFVVYQSLATNIVSGDTNAVQDIFVYDSLNKTTIRIGGNAASEIGDGYNVISYDGKGIVFISSATDFDTTDLNGKADVFLYEMETGVVSRISVFNETGTRTYDCKEAGINHFGDYITYIYPADKNSPLAEQPFGGVWRFQRSDTTLHRIDVGNDEAVSGVSADMTGEKVTFVTAKMLLPADIDTYKDVYLKDMKDNVLSLISADSSSYGYTNCSESVISSYGNFVSFTADTTGVLKVYTKDIVKDLEVLSVNSANNCASLSFAGGERYLTYATKTSLYDDVFIQSKGFYAEYDTPSGSSTVLSKDANGIYTLTFKDQNIIEFDAQGYQSKRQDPNGNQILYTHTDTNGDGIKELVSITDPGNLIYTFAYTDGKLTSITDPASRVTLFNIDADNNLTSITDANGGVFSYVYDGADIITSKTDNNGNTTQYVFDEYNMIKQRIEAPRDVVMTDAAGDITTVNKNVLWEYFPEDTVGAVNYLSNGDKADNPATMTLFNDVFGYYTADGKLFDYKTRHNAFKQPVLYKDAFNRETVLSYDSKGRLTKQVMPDRGTTVYTYDLYDNLINSTQTDVGASTDFVYNTLINKVTSVTDAENRQTQFGYDAKGNLTSVTDADNKVEIITRNPDGTVSAKKDRRNNTTNYEYDTKKRLNKIVYPSDYVTDPLKTFTYDAKGNIETIMNEEGHITTMLYDNLNNLKQIQTPLGFITSFEYDANNNLIYTVDERLNETKFFYNSVNLLEKIIYSDGTSEKYYYDALGRKVRTENISSDGLTVQKNTFVYNEAGELIKSINDNGDVTSYTYTPNSQVLSVTDPAGNVTSYSYDKAGRLLNKTKADASVIAYAYDKTGLVTQLTDENNNSTLYSYTNLSQLDTVTYPDASFLDYNYDTNGNVERVKNRNNSTINYTYDQRNRTQTMTLPGGDVHTYSYDRTGLLKGIVRGANTLSYTYDNDSRLTSEGLSGELVSYGYDNAGNTTSITLPDTTLTSYTYNNVNGISSITQVSNSYGYTYDKMGRLEKTNLPNGTNTVYGYDNLNRILSIITSRDVNSAQLAKAVYSYNNRNQRTSKQTLTGTTHYDYDALGRLNSIILPDSQGTTYTYNNTYSRIQRKDSGNEYTTYKSNNLNRYTKAGMHDIAYDANGNVINDGTNTYTYDALNRLIQGVTATKTVNYTYDPSGKLYSREVINNADSAQVSYKRFIYSGDNVIMTKDASGTVIERYILGGGVDNQLAVITATGTYYFNRDGLGSVVSVTDSTGAVIEKYEYSTFGKPTIKNAAGVEIFQSTIGNKLMFTGRMWDAELGLYDYRARVYNPKLGVFYQTDPLGYHDSTNMYAYCINDPVNFVDPFGEVAISSIIGGAALIAYMIGGNPSIGEAPEANGKCSGYNATFLERYPSIGMLKDAALGTTGFVGIKNAVKAYKAYKYAKNQKHTFPDEVWDQKAPKQVEPGAKNRSRSYERYNPKTKEYEKSDVYYDEYGRQTKRVDYSNHGRSNPADKEYHTNPHEHNYKYGPGTETGAGTRKNL